MENGIWEFANTKLTLPTIVVELVIHNQKHVKAKRIILDAMKEHVIPHLAEKKTIETCEASMKLCQSDDTNRKMVLREKIRNTKMTKSDIMTSYLTKMT